MRTISLVALLLAGCSCSDSVDPLDDGSVSLDATALDGGDGALGDGDLAPDAGRRDCAEYARVICASAESCYREWIWVVGSVERCEAFMRGECEYERSLEDAGDRATAALACYEEHTDCELYRGEIACPLPAGTRGEGAPCRSTLQCAEGLWCAGTESSFHGGPIACDTGTCLAPLAEGATDCRSREDGNACAENLRCVEVDGGTRCVPQGPLPTAGEPCDPGSGCGQGFYCRDFTTCEPVLTNGTACDPSEIPNGFVGPCGSTDTYECDRGTRTCVQFERAFAGDPCGPEGARCAGVCVDGICTSLWAGAGEPCETTSDCWIYTCVEGTCAPATCE